MILTDLTEAEVDDIDNATDAYVPLPPPARKSKPRTKKSAKHAPTTDAAENSLINTIWFYNNSDAS